MEAMEVRMVAHMAVVEEVMVVHMVDMEVVDMVSILNYYFENQSV